MMISPHDTPGPTLAASSPQGGLGAVRSAPRPVFRMEQGDRMAGSVPVWGAPESAREETLAALHAAEPFHPTAPDGALTYQPDHAIDPALRAETPFGFGDLVDLVNPLHHIPIVGSLYREVTGDTIRPSGRVFGGALFGGPLGAAAGMVNVIVAAETGATIDEHAIAAFKDEPRPETAAATTLARLDHAATAPADQPPTPETLLAFAATRHYESAAQKTARQTWKFNE